MINNLPVFETSVFAEWVSGTAQALPATICGVTQDTRLLTPGCMYVALRGERVDGHNFVEQALRSGAAVALVEHTWRAPAKALTWPLIRVHDTRKALCDAARAWRRQNRALLIGVTGSSGKTTVKEMTAILLRVAGNVCTSQGNYNNEIGLPLSLLTLQPNTAYGVFELGTNHPGEIAKLTDILQPRVAIISSIGSAHIEYFGSLDAIAHEKGALLSRLPRDGFAVLCQETHGFDLLCEMSAAPVITTSLVTREADYSGVVLNSLEGTLRVLERKTGLQTILHSGLPGEHNAYNLLLAFATIRHIGVECNAASQALTELVLPSMRWEVSTHHGVTVINDAYNANPQSMLASLKTFMNRPCKRRRYVVLGDMLELGEQAEVLHQEVGREVATLNPDGLIVVGVFAQSALAETAVQAGYTRSQIYGYADAEAAKACRVLFKQGDSVLLKASRGIRLERLLDDWEV